MTRIRFSQIVIDFGNAFGLASSGQQPDLRRLRRRLADERDVARTARDRSAHRVNLELGEPLGFRVAAHENQPASEAILGYRQNLARCPPCVACDRTIEVLLGEVARRAAFDRNQEKIVRRGTIAPGSRGN